MADLMEKIVSLTKRRGFLYPGSEIYGGVGGIYDLGPLGVELANNIKTAWWKNIVRGRDNVVGLDSAILMNRQVWHTSGHVESFADPLVECKSCHSRFREDMLPKSKNCPTCGKNDWTAPRMFNLMFKTHIGPVEEEGTETFLRPETAQGIFVNFGNVVDTMRVKLPFGIAQIGKAFRNEINTKNFLFRTREFEQMEMQFFVKEGEDKKQFEKIMAEINQAYMAKDLETLEALAQTHGSSLNSGSKLPTAELARLKLELRQLDAMIFEIEQTIRELDLSPAMQMRGDANDGRPHRRDILREMEADYLAKIADLREQLLALGLEIEEMHKQNK